MLMTLLISIAGGLVSGVISALFIGYFWQWVRKRDRIREWAELEMIALLPDMYSANWAIELSGEIVAPVMKEMEAYAVKNRYSLRRLGSNMFEIEFERRLKERCVQYAQGRLKESYPEPKPDQYLIIRGSRSRGSFVYTAKMCLRDLHLEEYSRRLLQYLEDAKKPFGLSRKRE